MSKCVKKDYYKSHTEDWSVLSIQNGSKYANRWSLKVPWQLANLRLKFHFQYSVISAILIDGF